MEPLKPLTIENWGVVTRTPNPYVAPECGVLCVSGEIKDHPTRGDTDITTSRIVGAEGRLITTSSGSVYRLGEPHPEYLAYLEKTGRVYDPAQPIKVVTR